MEEGKYHMVHTHKQRPASIWGLLSKGEIASPRNEPPNWLSKTKWSLLKSYTNQAHQTDSADCIYASVHVHIHIYNNYNKKEGISLRGKKGKHGRVYRGQRVG